MVLDTLRDPFCNRSLRLGDIMKYFRIGWPPALDNIDAPTEYTYMGRTPARHKLTATQERERKLLDIERTKQPTLLGFKHLVVRVFPTYVSAERAENLCTGSDPSRQRNL